MPSWRPSPWWRDSKKPASGKPGAVQHVQRAQIVLLSADRLPMLEIAKRIGVSRPMVWRWQQRYAEQGLDGLLRDKTWPPGTPPVPQAKVHAVVERTLREPPGAVTHWTGRAMAKAMNLSLRTVQRIWAAYSRCQLLAGEKWSELDAENWFFTSGPSIVMLGWSSGTDRLLRSDRLRFSLFTVDFGLRQHGTLGMIARHQKTPILHQILERDGLLFLWPHGRGHLRLHVRADEECPAAGRRFNRAAREQSGKNSCQPRFS